MRNLLLTGAAMVLLATPAIAGRASKAEIEATRQLNLQAAQAAAPSQPAPMSEAVMNAPPTAAPTIPVQTGSISTATKLSAVSNPPSKIATANVLDSSGRIVGAVQKVEVSPQGQPTRVSVALIGKGERMVVLDADAVRYDVAKNEIATDATAEQMSAMMNTR
jgi:lipoprotein-anchoring transpeptidase ErfK/SrfK